MKTKAKIALFLVLLVINFNQSALADFDETDHNRWTETMLFGNPSYSSSKYPETKANVVFLEDALMICIDEFSTNRNKCQEKLNHLITAHVPNLPSDISVIDFTAGNFHEETSHRAYTHRGWYYEYNSFATEKSHPEIRRQILISVVDYVFSFNKYSTSPKQAEELCDAMCCFLYNTHIIADRYHSSAYYGAVSTLPLAYSGAESVIQDLLICLPVLFKDQVKSDSNYSALIRKLQSMDSRIIKSHRANITSEEHLEIDQQYAKELRDILKQYIPDLLLQQTWFNHVFSLKWSGNQYQ